MTHKYLVVRRMKLIPRYSGKKKKQPVLSLSVHVGQTRNVDIFETFDCCPVCYVTTNNYFTQKTHKLSHSNSKWNQILKLTLPKNPTDDLLRVIVYDVIPQGHSSSSASTTPSSVNSSSVSLASISTQQSNHVSPMSPTGRSFSSTVRPKLINRNNTELSTNSLRTMYSLGNTTSQQSISPSTKKFNDHHAATPTLQSNNIHTNNNEKSSHSHKYMYIGEAQLSIHELFRDPENNNHFHFNQLPNMKWYALYDKKREKQYKDSTSLRKSFPIGEIQLSFALTSNMKRQYTTLQAFMMWQDRLIKKINGKRHRKLIKVARENESDQEVSQEQEQQEIVYDEDHIGFDSLSQLNSPTNSDVSMSSIVSMTDSSFTSTNTNSEFDDDFISTDNNQDDYDQDEDEEDDGFDHANPVDMMDLKSLVTALDEYDVVKGPVSVIKADNSKIIPQHLDGNTTPQKSLTYKDFEDIENILNEPPSVIRDIIDDTDTNSSFMETSSQINVARSRTNSLSSVGSDIAGYSEDLELSTDSENEHVNTSLQFKPNGSKLLRLRKKTKSNYSRHYNMNHHWENNFQVSKKQHSLGVVFMEIQNIVELPALKSKLSRRKYDMDPFVITTFGRRVFKTSAKNHTLNPYYNEFISFEIFPNENQFSFHFKVMDKDSFSFHDEVAECDLPWFDIMARWKIYHHERTKKTSHDDGWLHLDLPMEILHTQDIISHPMLKIKIKYAPYHSLKRNFWKYAVYNNTKRDDFDMVDLLLFLDKLGSFSDKDAIEFFNKYNKLAWAGDSITRRELIKGLETWKKTSEFKNVWKCPKCFKERKKSNVSKKSKLTSENDLITHFALCTFDHKHKVLKPSYVSMAFASKRWFSKVLIKMSYGKYALGSNNANILVQDRDTGIILEEKISAHVKVGLRIIYNGKGKESKKFRHLLKRLSVRQGKKFDSPNSVKQIESFIKFHHLDMSQCLDSSYRTFNEFFYRRLKPGSRPVENTSSKYMVSPADSRCTVFSSIAKSKEIWIKSSKFTVNRLTKGYNNDRYNNMNTSMAIFRLAPQDYHRFHSPCDVIIGKPIDIGGEYYTVNPMAIRSELDVFGENVRTIIPMKSAEFGEFLMIAVGAMMVGSIVLTCKEGDFIKKGEEVGYFKFGGSTIILLIPTSKIKFDSDLINNTTEEVETLVRVGMSLGHTPDVKDMKRKRHTIVDNLQLERIKRTISVTAENISRIGGVTWQYDTLTHLMKDDYGKDDVVTIPDNHS